MTARRKRLKKLMQSIGIQRNDFENALKSMYGRERDYQTREVWDDRSIIEWIRHKQVFSVLTTDSISKSVRKLKTIGVNVKDKDGFKTTWQVLSEISEKWNSTN